MANGNILSQALNRSTPGFDSLINTIQEQTNKVERNREIARQLQQRKDLAKFQADLEFQQQKKQLEQLRPIELQQQTDAAIDQYKQQQEIKLDSLPEQRRSAIREYAAKRQIDLATAVQEYEEITKPQLEDEQQQELNEQQRKDLQRRVDAKAEGEKLQSSIYTEYSASFDTGLMPTFKVQPYNVGQGVYQNYVLPQDGSGQIIDPMEWKNKAQVLQPLGGFIQKLQDKTNVVATKDGSNIVIDGTTYITRDNMNDYAKDFTSASFDQKRQYANQINNGDIRIADPEMHPELKTKLAGTGADEDINLEAGEETLKGRIIDVNQFYEQNPTIDLEELGLNEEFGKSRIDISKMNQAEVKKVRARAVSWLEDENWLRERKKEDTGRSLRAESGKLYVDNYPPVEWEEHPKAKKVRDLVYSLQTLEDAQRRLQYSDVPYGDAPPNKWIYNPNNSANENNLRDLFTTGMSKPDDTEAVSDTLNMQPNPYLPNVDSLITDN